MANKSDIGYVYIFTNESFREGWVKIGKTRNIKQRLTQLDNTSCPLPFDVYATLKTNRYHDAEDFVHDFISHFNQSLRIRPNREYFKVSPEEALDILYKVKKLMNEPDSEIKVYDEKGSKLAKQFEKKHSRNDNNERVDCNTEDNDYKFKTHESSTTWLLSSNVKYFDLKKCFQNEECVFWQVKSNFKTVKKGDRGYIYSSAPDKSIIYSFNVEQGPMPYSEEMDREDEYSKLGKNSDWGKQGGTFVKLKLTKIKKNNSLSLGNLMSNGLNGAPQNAIIISQDKYHKLLQFIENNAIEDFDSDDVDVSNSVKLSSLKTLPAYLNYLNSDLTIQVMKSLKIDMPISKIKDIAKLEELRSEIKKVEKIHRYHNTHSCAISQYIKYLKAGFSYDDMAYDVSIIKNSNKL